jgi:hypothetical protein
MIDTGQQPADPLMLFAAAAKHYSRKGNRVIGTVEDFLTQAHARLAVARNSLIEGKRKMAEIYDKRIPDWQVGDKVFLSAYMGDQSARIRFPGLGPSKALSPARLGPHPVIGKVGMNAYRLDMPRSVKIHPVINARYLTLARESKFYPDHRGDSVAENPPAFYDEEYKEDIVFEVENILHKRVKGTPCRGLRT